MVLAFSAGVVARTLFLVRDVCLACRHPVIWRTYLAVRRAERIEPPHRPSFEAVWRARASLDDIRVLTWGETPLVHAYELLRQAGVGPGTHVLDAGAGRGMVLLAARALGADATGIELDPRRVAAVADAMVAVGADLREGNALGAPLVGVTHVWLSWTCFPARVREATRRWLLGLPAGARVVCLTWPLHDEAVPQRGPFALLRSQRCWFPWGSMDVMVVERRDDEACPACA